MLTFENLGHLDLHDGLVGENLSCKPRMDEKERHTKRTYS